MKYVLLIAFIALNSSIKAEFTSDELQEICKVWGVIKYKTKSTKSIDLELIQILKEELKLDDFVLSHTPNKVNPNKIEKFNDFSIINNISKKTLNSLVGSKNPIHYSFKKTTKKDVLKVLDEDTYSRTISKEIKLLGIFRLWNYLNYSFLKPNSQEKIDASLKESIEILLSDKENHYEKAIYNLYNKLNDSHSSCYLEHLNNKRTYISSIVDEVSFIDILPFKAYKKDEVFIVYEVLNTDISLEINDTIIQINETNPSTFYSEKYRLFSFNKIESYTLKTNSSIITIPKSKSVNYTEYKYFKNPIQGLKNYYYISEIEKQDQKNINLNIKNNEDIIIDCRNYPKSYTINKVMESLKSTNRKTLLFHFVSPNKKNLGENRIRYNYNYKKIKYSGKIRLLINKSSQSWTEFLVLGLCNNENVELIGTHSSNAMGECAYILPLPGNFYFKTTNYFLVPNTIKYDAKKGLIPDIFVDDWKMEVYLKKKQNEQIR